MRALQLLAVVISAGCAHRAEQGARFVGAPVWVPMLLVGIAEPGGGGCTRQPCRDEDPPDCPCATRVTLTVTRGELAGAKVSFDGWHFGCRGTRDGGGVTCPFAPGAELKVRASITCPPRGTCFGRKLPDAPP